MAGLARRLANTVVEWEDIRALMANWLIALNKCPGVRPIGIGEALQHVLGKIVALATRADLEEVCGTDQLCSGLQAGMEGAIHAVKELFDVNCDAGWGLLLVDAKDAFNSLNRVAALWNARVLWPICSRFLFAALRRPRGRTLLSDASAFGAVAALVILEEGALALVSFLLA